MKKNKKMLLAILLILVVITFFVVLKFSVSNPSNKEFIINNTYNEIKIGEYKEIEYTLSDNSVVEWTSEDDSIATVDNSGIIKGINYGKVTITGKVTINNREVTERVAVLVYSGDQNIEIERIEVPDGYLLMGVNSQYNLPFVIVPNNAYIDSIEYEINDPTIIDIENNKINAKMVGKSEIEMIINNRYNKSIMVNVIDDRIENRIVKEVETVSFNEDKINIQINERKKLEYTINPTDAYIYEVKWVSSDLSVVDIENNEIIGKKAGKATVYLIINDEIIASIDVNVEVMVEGIKVDYYPKKLLRIGETTNIEAHTLPENATDKTIIYRSSNPSVASVNNGIIRGLSAGTSIITLTANGISETAIINVLPNKGVINGTGNLWGYESLNEKTPVRADINFFRKLASEGRGIVSGNIYTYTVNNVRYTYDVSKSLLTANGTQIMVRFYYPLNSDLSSLNMTTFLGGIGENNFDGYANDIEKNKSLIRNAGIIVLVTQGSKYDTDFNQYAANYATSFAKIIFNQSITAKNTIGGFSSGATKVMNAAYLMNYDRIVIFSSYHYWISDYANKLKNKEIIVYIPNDDVMYTQAKKMINEMKKYGYNNVIIVTNSTELGTLYGNDFLIINPGSLMINKHDTGNISRARMFSYLND